MWSVKQLKFGKNFSLSNYSIIRNGYLHGEVMNAILGLKHSVAQIKAKSFNRFQNTTDYVDLVSKQDTC